MEPKCTTTIFLVVVSIPVKKKRKFIIKREKKENCKFTNETTAKEREREWV